MGGEEETAHHNGLAIEVPQATPARATDQTDV